MDILIIIEILAFYAVRGIVNAATPETPPITNTTEHLRKIQADFLRKY